MLLEYKNNYEKITMGLMSFIPDFKEVSRLKFELDWYNQEESRKLFLWRGEETQDFIAVIGVETGDDLILLRHISINPSFRNEGISYKILEALEKHFTGQKIIGTLETAQLIVRWEQEKNKINEQDIVSTTINQKEE
ncbi:GNAT family N-acetyltransferase [Carnobacterium sp.]|uniref:GNAT family N-acetyltransferase n=1 Tax=Carnobacterium sp. TaxID=48221 RepID=UPI003C728B06